MNPSQPIRRFEESDARPELLERLCVAVLGYGNQGHAHALNLRDSGVDVVVGARAGGRGASRAIEDGFEPVELGAAAARGDIVMVLLPDEIQSRVFEEEILPNWKTDAVLALGHGFALAFAQIRLPEGRRAFLCAPKGQGHKLRQAYRAGGGLPGLLATAGPREEETLELALAYAHACGALKGGGFLSSFREEAISDQFGEQAVLCGGLIELIVAAWETLVERGYSPEIAYFECLHEVKLIVDLIHEHGIDGMREKISTTAAHGGLRAASRVIGEVSRAQMRALLDEIESGEYATEFLAAQSDGGRALRAAAAREASHPIVATGRGLRDFLARCRLGQNESSEE